MTNQLSRYLLGAAVVSVMSVACSNQLRDYTELTLKALPPQPLSPDQVAVAVTEETVEATQAVLQKRLSAVGLSRAEFTIEAPDTIILRVPQGAPLEAIAPLITNRGLLTFRSQKPETETELADNIAALQRLLVDQNTLQQTGNIAEAEALQPQIDETRAQILSLFEPSELTSEMIADAKAVQNTGFKVWEVRLWFNSEGTDKFAQQTQALAGTGRALGIFLEDVLLSAPTVGIDYAQAGIVGGEATVSGNFTREAAKALEVEISSGELPLALEIVSVRSSADSATEPTEDPAEEPTDETADETTNETDTTESEASSEDDTAEDAEKDAEEADAGE